MSKMAPVCLSACHQLLPVQLLPVRSLFYLCVFSAVPVALFRRLTDDRQMLMHIQGSMEIQNSGCLGSSDRCPPAFIYPGAEYVRRLPCCISRHKKRRRGRGKRGGIRVRIRSEAGVIPRAHGTVGLPVQGAQTSTWDRGT